MRIIYCCLYTLLLPFILMRYLIRSIKQPYYRHHLSERLSFNLPVFSNLRPVHFHFVSVGESIAASALVHRIRELYPDLPILITVTTPTGRKQCLSQFDNLSDIHVCYLPFDTPIIMERFFSKLQPQVSVLMETEIWPYFIAIAKRHQIPIALINARMSKKSFKGYKKLEKLSKPMFSNLDLVLAQYRPDKKRLIKLGCLPERVRTTGNIKFDTAIPEAVVVQGRAIQPLLKRPVWIAISTHEGEEVPVLQAHKRLMESCANALLVIVPRHKERFDSVADIISQSELSYVRRTQTDFTNIEKTNVVLGDSMGEMFFYMAFSNIAFVGGSLIEHGGHNPIEPALLGLPLLTGPHLRNFKLIYKQCIELGFCQKIQDGAELSQAVRQLFSDEDLCASMGQKAQKFVTNNQGAINNVTHNLIEFIDNRSQNNFFQQITTNFLRE